MQLGRPLRVTVRRHLTLSVDLILLDLQQVQQVGHPVTLLELCLVAKDRHLVVHEFGVLLVLVFPPVTTSSTGPVSSFGSDGCGLVLSCCAGVLQPRHGVRHLVGETLGLVRVGAGLDGGGVRSSVLGASGRTYSPVVDGVSAAEHVVHDTSDVTDVLHDRRSTQVVGILLRGRPRVGVVVTRVDVLRRDLTNVRRLPALPGTPPRVVTPLRLREPQGLLGGLLLVVFLRGEVPPVGLLRGCLVLLRLRR
mmetsp:Transcript_27536/g.66175  ORF Transcript_27536/g.66175 Transcript_27536/m.66175 type:complete len:250 (-) Transcript_27536:448-1197(-)